MHLQHLITCSVQYGRAGLGDLATSSDGYREVSRQGLGDSATSSDVQ